MEQQKQFSHGLLYSVPPENFKSLHLQDESGLGEFEWDEFKPRLYVNSMASSIRAFLKKIAADWGITKH
jgi:hypothetical protein